MHKIFVHLEKKEEEEDEKEEFEEERSHEEKRSVKVHAMVSVFQFIMKQSYICALIAMMVCMGGGSVCWRNGEWSSRGSKLHHPLMANTDIFMFPTSWQRMVGYVNFSWDLYDMDFKIPSSTLFSLLLNLNTFLSNWPIKSDRPLFCQFKRPLWIVFLCGIEGIQDSHRLLLFLSDGESCIHLILDLRETLFHLNCNKFLPV